MRKWGLKRDCSAMRPRLGLAIPSQWYNSYISLSAPYSHVAWPRHQAACVHQWAYDPQGGLHWSCLQWSHPYIWACTGGSICRACWKCELRESRESRCTLFQDMRHRLCLPMVSAGWEEGLWVIESCGSHRGMAAQQWVTWMKEERAQWSLFLLRNIGVQAGIAWEEQEACNWALYLLETYLTV